MEKATDLCEYVGMIDCPTNRAGNDPSPRVNETHIAPVGGQVRGRVDVPRGRVLDLGRQRRRPMIDPLAYLSVSRGSFHKMELESFSEDSLCETARTLELSRYVHHVSTLFLRLCAVFKFRPGNVPVRPTRATYWSCCSWRVAASSRCRAASQLTVYMRLSHFYVW